ncbi:hypothetical protein AB0395_34825 [Streptosporangium sp. NPDC051023]|uniref:hypothetical protein n=1 Tax=Streptosporangium sp. NPDC051023 TaxID=3155410 RepID=UPI003450034B
MGVSPQALTVIRALRAIGVPRKAFRVRTERTRCSWIHPDTGKREVWFEYGDANAMLDAEGRALVVEHVQELVAQGLTVTIWRYPCGHNSKIMMVSSDWNPRKVVSYPTMEATCRTCTPTGE